MPETNFQTETTWLTFRQKWRQEFCVTQEVLLLWQRQINEQMKVEEIAKQEIAKQKIAKNIRECALSLELKDNITKRPAPRDLAEFLSILTEISHSPLRAWVFEQLYTERFFHKWLPVVGWPDPLLYVSPFQGWHGFVVKELEQYPKLAPWFFLDLLLVLPFWIEKRKIQKDTNKTQSSEVLAKEFSSKLSEYFASLGWHEIELQGLRAHIQEKLPKMYSRFSLDVARYKLERDGLDHRRRKP